MKEWLNNTSQVLMGGAVVIALIMLGLNLATWGAVVTYAVLAIVAMVASIIVEDRENRHDD